MKDCISIEIKDPYMEFTEQTRVSQDLITLGSLHRRTPVPVERYYTVEIVYCDGYCKTRAMIKGSSIRLVGAGKRQNFIHKLFERFGRVLGKRVVN